MEAFTANRANLSASNEMELKEKMSSASSDNNLKTLDQKRKDECSLVKNEDPKNVSLYSVSAFSGIFIGTIVVCPTLLIPQHYIMEHPEKWYEFTLLSSFGWCGSLSAVMILNFSCWMDVKEIKSWTFFFILYFVSAFTTISLNLIMYVIWTVTFKFHPPVPYGGCSVRIITLHVMMATIWFRLPNIHRQAQTTRQRMKSYYFTELIFLATFWVYLLLGKTFLSIPRNFQWILAVFVPFLREIISRGVIIISNKEIDSCKSVITMAYLHAIGSRHAIFLSVAVSSILDELTCYVLLGMDFLINVVLCLRIIRSTQKKSITPPNALKDDEATLNELALNERIEFVVPLLYFISFFIAYYGPNATLIGSIKNTLWHFTIVADVKQAATNMAILFGIDICSAILCSVLLWFSCKISLFRAYTNIQKDFWLILAAQEAYLLVEVII